MLPSSQGLGVQRLIGLERSTGLWDWGGTGLPGVDGQAPASLGVFISPEDWFPQCHGLVPSVPQTGSLGGPGAAGQVDVQCLLSF